MFRRSGGLKKTGGFGRPFKQQAHLDLADPGGSAAGRRGPLGLRPHQWGSRSIRPLPTPFRGPPAWVLGSTPIGGPRGIMHRARSRDTVAAGELPRGLNSIATPQIPPSLNPNTQITAVVNQRGVVVKHHRHYWNVSWCSADRWPRAHGLLNERAWFGLITVDPRHP